jgi:hypothetical protein
LTIVASWDVRVRVTVEVPVAAVAIMVALVVAKTVKFSAILIKKLLAQSLWD